MCLTFWSIIYTLLSLYTILAPLAAHSTEGCISPWSKYIMEKTLQSATWAKNKKHDSARWGSWRPLLKLSNTLTVWDLNESSTQHNDGKWWMARNRLFWSLIVTLWETRNTSSSKSTEVKWSLMQKITAEMSPLNVRTHRTEGYDDTRVR